MQDEEYVCVYTECELYKSVYLYKNSYLLKEHWEELQKEVKPAVRWQREDGEGRYIVQLLADSLQILLAAQSKGHLYNPTDIVLKLAATTHTQQMKRMRWVGTLTKLLHWL